MDTNYKIVFTEESRDEIRNIYNYISKNLYAEKSAKNLMLKIEETVNNLKYSPFLHQRVKKYTILDKEYRRAVVKNYVILYDIEEDNKTVYIDHILHESSNYINEI